MASIKSKVKKAVTSYAKNVAGGAKIVGSALSSAAKKVGAGSQTGAVLKAVVPKGTSIAPKQYVAPKATGYIPQTGTTYYGEAGAKEAARIKSILPPRDVQVYEALNETPPATESGYRVKGGSIRGGTNLLSSSVAKQVAGGGFLAPTNISPDGTTLYNTRSFSSSSVPSGTNVGSTTTSTPTTNVLGVQDLGADSKKLTFPEATLPDYTKETPAPIVLPETTEKDTALKDYLKTLSKETPSSEDAYKRAQEETEIFQKQQLVNDLTGQLNAIVNRGQAQQLAQVGQGRGIPEAIIGGIQAQIGRETAIAALPIQAQLSAAQGNLEMANDNLETLFKIYSDDAEREYSIRKEQKKMVYDIATEKEKRALEKADKAEERAYQETKDLNDERLAYSKMAFETGQSGLGAKIAKLDYKSPTFRADLANLSSQIVDTKRNLEIKKLQNDLVMAGTTINPKILTTTQFKNAQAAQNLKLTLEEAKVAVEKYGNYEQLSGTGKGILDTLKIRLASQISTALEQGVVMPGEMENFQKVAGQLQSSIFTRNSKTLGSINSLLAAMDARVALQKAALTNTYNVSDEQVDTLLNITDLSDQEFADMDALIE